MPVGNRHLVSALNTAAEALGIVPGIPLSDARALHPALIVAEADPVGDGAALQRLARWCQRYSPWTVPHGGDAIFLDITGCAHLRGGEASLASELVDRLRQQGITGRAAIADTPGAAWAVARCGGAESAVVPPEEGRSAIADLPVAALRLNPVLAVELEQLGLRRISDLYVLPRAALATRFDPALMLRLDQALGKAVEPLSPLPPISVRWVRHRFAEPIGTAEALSKTLQTLLKRLCAVLGKDMLGTRRLALTCHRVDGAPAQVTIRTARPTRDPRHLFRLLADRLASIDPGLGIEDMILAAMSGQKLVAAQLRLPTQSRLQPAAACGKILSFPVRRMVARQAAGLMPAAKVRDHGADAAELAVLVDRLGNRLGLSSVGRVDLRQSHVPEQVQRLAPVFASAKNFWRLDRPRPLRLLPRPEAIGAVTRMSDDQPILFHWRRLLHRVHRVDGPERLCGEWWRDGKEADVLRDYYHVEDEEGRRFWLYRDGLFLPPAEPRWFLHGLFA
jgi:protein ImuB